MKLERGQNICHDLREGADMNAPASDRGLDDLLKLRNCSLTEQITVVSYLKLSTWHCII